MNVLSWDARFTNQWLRTSRPDPAQPVDPVIRQSTKSVLPMTHQVAAVLTRVILRVSLLGPVPIKRESVLGSSTGAAVQDGSVGHPGECGIWNRKSC